MLDLQFIADHLSEVQENCQHRGVTVDLEEFSRLRQERRTLIQDGDALRAEQKSVSALIPKATPDERPALVAKGKELREQIAGIEERSKAVEEALRSIQVRIPNLTHPDSPRGAEADSRELRRVGQIREFDFTPLDHVQLAERLDLVEFEAAAKVTGHGFYFLKNEAVLLELALVQYAVQMLVKEGFTLYTTPDLARAEVLEGVGFNPRGAETQIYSIAGTDLSLVATAEITLGGLLKDEIVDRSSLPRKLAGISHCFRTEAGAHGKASRGIYRVHQFTKVEMFAYAGPDVAESDAIHAEILRIEEAIFTGLGIPYRVLDIATGDMGGPAYRKFDLEAWMPGRQDWGEVTSCSNCTDYQARRLGVRCREPGQKGTQFVHTLNGTAVAVTRALIAVLENYQQADGSVDIPAVLRPWVGVDRIVPRSA